MKKTKITFWIVTILFVLFIAFGAIADVMLVDDAKTVMHHLGYPDYFTQFIGVAKLLGCIALVIPGFPRITEWAYAGLFFDLTGAAYSGIAVDGFQPGVLFILLPFALLLISYRCYHRLYAETAG